MTLPLCIRTVDSQLAVCVAELAFCNKWYETRLCVQTVLSQKQNNQHFQLIDSLLLLIINLSFHINACYCTVIAHYCIIAIYIVKSLQHHHCFVISLFSHLISLLSHKITSFLCAGKRVRLAALAILVFMLWLP